jgi:hypothetical protein
VERSFAWASRFRRLANDDERLPEVVAGLPFLAFVSLLLHRLFTTAVPCLYQARAQARPQATRIAAVLSGLRDPAHQPVLEQRRALAAHRASVGGHWHRPDWHTSVQHS